MKLEDQVCNLKLSKKLKELGVEQKSNWYWYDIVGESEKEQEDSAQLGDADYVLEFKTFRPYFATFTVAQLGEMLPERIYYGNKIPYKLDITKDKTGWYVLYSQYPSIYTDSIEAFKNCHAVETTEANARAKMLIYLLENNLIKGDVK